MDFKVGDRVKIDPAIAGRWHGITFEIEKLLVKNANLKSPHAPRGLRAPISSLVPADTAEVTNVPTTFEPPLTIGTLVRFKNDLYVVMQQNPRSGRYRIVKLGGDDGRYYTNVVRSHMEVVEVSELTRVMV